MSRHRKILIWSAVTLGLVAALVFGVRRGRAEYHLWSARRDLDRHRLAAARDHLARCLNYWPDRADVHLLACRAARRADDLETADHHRSECQRLEGVPSEESHLEWALIRAQVGDVDTVEERLRGLVDRKHPQSALILEAMGKGYLTVYRTYDALNCLKQWLEMEPDSAPALALRGRVFQRVHAYGRAADDFRKVLDREPDNDAVRFQLANALIENSQAPDAVPHLEQLRQRRPRDVEVRVRLAFAWLMAGKVGPSRDLLDEVLRDDPGNGPALSARGQVELQTNNPVEAERRLRLALKEMPFDRQTHFVLLRALQQQDKESEARDQEARLKDLEATIDRMMTISNRLLPAAPHDSKLHFELATLLARVGREPLAERWYLSAVQYDPNHKAAHAALAAYYDKTGQPDKAAEHRGRVGKP